MAQSWYSIVEEEMSRVDDVMRTEVRSAYPELNKMCDETMNSRYHVVRPALCILSYYANGGKDVDIAVNTASCFEAVFEGLHLHDRIDSNGQVSGLKKKMFSKVPSTTKVIVAGDFMYVMGFRQAYGKVPKIVPYLMEASASISDAIFKITDNEHNAQISEQECLDIMRDKSAIEYEILMECAAKQAGADEESLKIMRECGLYIGMALQLEADIEDLFDDKASMETMITGYPTLPIYYSMQDEVNGQKIKNLFSKEDLDQKEAVHAVTMIAKTDAVDRCRSMIKEYLGNAVSVIGKLPDSDYKSAIIAFAGNGVM